MRLLFVLCCFCGLLRSPGLAAADFVAIMHDSVPIDQVDERTIRNAFLGRKTIWVDSPIVLVLSRQRSGRQAVKQVTGRDHDRLLRGWKRLTFSGNGSMPTVVDDDAAAIALVQRTRGAIALIARPADGVPAGTQLLSLPDPE